MVYFVYLPLYLYLPFIDTCLNNNINILFSIF
nr:MAG TPA: hypothetical protein [Caudoviricetes sp.]